MRCRRTGSHRVCISPLLLPTSDTPANGPLAANTPTSPPAHWSALLDSTVGGSCFWSPAMITHSAPLTSGTSEAGSVACKGGWRQVRTAGMLVMLG